LERDWGEDSMIEHKMCDCPSCKAGEDEICLACATSWPCVNERYRLLNAKFTDFVMYVDSCDPSITDAYVFNENNEAIAKARAEGVDI
jgi:hypothetical protein